MCVGACDSVLFAQSVDMWRSFFLHDFVGRESVTDVDVVVSVHIVFGSYRQLQTSELGLGSDGASSSRKCGRSKVSSKPQRLNVSAIVSFDTASHKLAMLRIASSINTFVGLATFQSVCQH